MKRIFFSRNALFVCCFVIPGIFIFGMFRSFHSDIPVRLLPYYGTTKYDTLKKGTSILIDTNYFHVPGFHFRSQNGNEVTDRDLAGSIYVAEYFITSDSGKYRTTMKNMETVYQEFKENPDVKFVSFTGDSAALLRKYAREYDADATQWLFLTGNKNDLFKLARYGYLLEPGTDEAKFNLTSQLVLVDKEGHIRGYYDGARDREIEKLKVEINLLLRTYDYDKKHTIQPPS